MARSHRFASLTRTLRSARALHAAGLSTAEGLDAAREARAIEQSRRQFLKTAGVLAGSSAALWHPRSLRAAPPVTTVDVAIVGAGLAGLVCADRLEANGVVPTLYDASSRVGGRCFTLGGEFGGPVTFPGQVAERGGEFIDNLHKTMLAYAQEFDLAREDVTKDEGDVRYHFGGELVDEETIVDEFRDFVAAMHDDLQASSGAPTAADHNDADLDLDHTSLAEYLETRGAGPNLYDAIEQAYLAEYGLEIDEQSSLNFLLFMHADKRSRFTPFGVFSDERFHLVDGNQQIPARIFDRLDAPTFLEHRLVKAKKTADGRVELTFKKGNKTIVKTHDAVVFAVPFSVLRDVTLDASLGLSAPKRDAIAELGYGMNAKTMLGFDGRPWVDVGCNGVTYSDLSNLQATWETNPSQATSARGIITDYASGIRGATLGSVNVQTAASQFLADLDVVVPGAAAAATRLAGNKLRVHREHWPSNPLTKGSYTCYLTGQFTSIAGLEGEQAGNVYFAGEHANSFYEWQGFMEGACLSGIDAADAILDDWG